MMRPVLLWWGIAAIAVAVAIGVVVTAPGTSPIDEGWNALMGQLRTPFLIGFGTVLDHVGGGWIASYLVPLVIIAALLLVRRWRAAVFVAAAMLASVATVQLIKGLFGRARPEDMLVLSDYGSFPSGHTANAATTAALAVLLFPRLWVLLVAVGWTLAMAFSRTALSVHWLSDTVGGMLIGAGVTLVIAAFALTWARRGGNSEPVPIDEPPARTPQ
jgi:membrane-associated phospholipid phosphatase